VSRSATRFELRVAFVARSRNRFAAICSTYLG
jgi:hypothetical protein